MTDNAQLERGEHGVEARNFARRYRIQGVATKTFYGGEHIQCERRFSSPLYCRTGHDIRVGGIFCKKE